MGKIIFQKHGSIYILFKPKPEIQGKELIILKFNNTISNNTNTSTSTEE
jgi:hypothetical protein